MNLPKFRFQFFEAFHKACEFVHITLFFTSFYPFHKPTNKMTDSPVSELSKSTNSAKPMRTKSLQVIHRLMLL
ncbi:MAG: hypothetical protein N0E45_17130, partial [Candidatus Thiodiazotropha endolucinida]|nr:hypothetical protein [Candidatus Thiodiazotropha taylori]MCW4301360.1 hypothetical protein [Candidatus Thiodiazotropha endolucinida]